MNKNESNISQENSVEKPHSELKKDNSFTNLINYLFNGYINLHKNAKVFMMTFIILGLVLLISLYATRADMNYGWNNDIMESSDTMYQNHEDNYLNSKVYDENPDEYYYSYGNTYSENNKGNNSYYYDSGLPYYGDENSTNNDYDLIYSNYSENPNYLTGSEILAVTLAIVLTVIFVLVISLISVYISAVSDYTALKLSKNESATLRESMVQAAKHYKGYLGVILYKWILIYLWSLLLIIPGIYKAQKYALVGVLYFDKKIHNKNVNVTGESNEMLKNDWLTMLYVSIINGVLGLFENLNNTAVRSEVYAKNLQNKNETKTK